MGREVALVLEMALGLETGGESEGPEATFS